LHEPRAGGSTGTTLIPPIFRSTDSPGANDSASIEGDAVEHHDAQHPAPRTGPTEALGRRALTGLAWSVPVVAVAIATPASASSTDPGPARLPAGFNIYGPTELLGVGDDPFVTTGTYANAEGVGVGGVRVFFESDAEIFADGSGTVHYAWRVTDENGFARAEGVLPPSATEAGVELSTPVVPGRYLVVYVER
jgi:hypothetical protein